MPSCRAAIACERIEGNPFSDADLDPMGVSVVFEVDVLAFERALSPFKEDVSDRPPCLPIEMRKPAWIKVQVKAA